MYHKIQFPSPPFSYHICLLVLGLFAGDATVPGMSRALLDRSLAGQRRRQLFVADLRCELLGSLEAGPRIPRTGSSEPIIDLTRVYAPIKLVCLARINWRWSQAFSLASSRLASSFFLLDICAFWPPSVWVKSFVPLSRLYPSPCLLSTIKGLQSLFGCLFLLALCFLRFLKSQFL